MKAKRPLGPCVSCGALVPDGDAPPYPGHVAGWMKPDPRDAELARLRAIVRDVGDENPCEFYGAFDDLRCFFCRAEFGSREEAVADVERHSPSCAWRRAREEAGER